MNGLAIAARLAEYVAAVVLFGAPLFFLYGLRGEGGFTAVQLGWPRRAFFVAAVVLLLGSAASLVVETATMTGDPSAALDPGAVWTVLTSSQFGLAVALRMGLAALLCVPALRAPTRGRWRLITALAAAAMASFAWTGHGAMDEGLAGLTHLIADLIHLWAAGVWLGALVVLAALAMSRGVAEEPTAVQALHDGLKGFSGIGAAVVALLALTGLVNSWFLIGLDHLGQILQSTYATMLAIKLLVFFAMLGLAALNRFALTPRLGRGLVGATPGSAMEGLRTSIVMETAGGLVVLGLVAVLGTLPPLSMT